MARKRVLFQGSHSSRGIAAFAPDQIERAQRIAVALGDALIRNDLDLILNSGKSLDSTVGKSAEAACNALGYDTRERIRTVPYGEAHGAQTYFGMVLEPLDKRYQEVRTFIVREADAVVALMGGKGTSDTIQKALLARKPVFPIPIAGGGAQLEWERLRRERYCNHTPGDIISSVISVLHLRTSQPTSRATVCRCCRRFILPIRREFLLSTVTTLQ